MKANKNRFRVYDKHTNRYLTDSPNGFVAIHNSTEILHPNIGTFSYLENYVVEQCTGIVDKNGILVYEGDIVKYEKYERIMSKDNDKGVSFEIVERGIVTGSICYSAPRFVICWKSEDDRYTGFDEFTNESKRLEVIGNVNFSVNKKLSILR